MAKAYGQWPLNVMQYGPETVAGTAVPATGIWRGPFGHFEDDRQTEQIEEDIGTFGRVAQEYITWLGVTVPAPAAALNLLQFPVIAQASMGKVTATGSGPYVRPFAAVFGDTDPALQSYTLRIGNKRVTADVQNMSLALVQEWELSGKQGELWKISSTWTAPRRVVGTFTANAPLPALDPVLFAKTSLYIDDSSGTIGTTQKLGVLLAASIKWRTNIEWVPVGDGNIYATAFKLGRPEITFALTYELEQDGAASLVATERAKYDTNAYRLLRLTLPGNGGANSMNLDWAGKYDSVGPYNKEGETNTSVTFEGRALYSSTDALFFKADHTSTLQTIP